MGQFAIMFLFGKSDIFVNFVHLEVFFKVQVVKCWWKDRISMACLYFTLHSNHLIAGSTSCICYIILTTGEGLNKWLN